MKIVVSLKIH